MDPRIHQAIIEAVDTRFRQLMSQQARAVYGTIESVDLVNGKVSVYLSGDTSPSPGFRFERPFIPVVGQLVRVVIDPRGDRYVEALGLPTTVNKMSLGTTTAPDNDIAIRLGSDLEIFRSNGQLGINGDQINLTRDSGDGDSSHVIQGQLDGDSNPRVVLQMDALEFGTGSGSPDNALQRLDAGELRMAAGQSIAGTIRGRYIKKTSDQTINSAGYNTVTSWQSTLYAGAGVTFDGTDELVVERAGLYLIYLNTSWAQNTSGIRLVGFGVNDTVNAPAFENQMRAGVTSDANGDYVGATIPAYLSASDRVSMRVWQNSGGNLALTDAAFGVFQLGYEL